VRRAFFIRTKEASQNLQGSDPKPSRKWPTFFKEMAPNLYRDFLTNRAPIYTIVSMIKSPFSTKKQKSPNNR
jgi:hypothetical protein